eukprot:6178474-Pleurochrysis_carterae.AAC.1
MSLAHRLLNIEVNIPYEDVSRAWKTQRTTWSAAVVYSATTKELAERALLLLDALVPTCIKYYWPDPDAYESMYASIKRVAVAEQADPRGLVLRAAFQEWEEKVLPKPKEAELPLMGNGKPDYYTFGSTGPELEVGDKCYALDIRMVWCSATIVQRQREFSGQMLYKVHYEGWKQRWDEWMARDSGRVRRDMPPSSLKGVSSVDMFSGSRAAPQTAPTTKAKKEPKATAASKATAAGTAAGSKASSVAAKRTAMKKMKQRLKSVISKRRGSKDDVESGEADSSAKSAAPSGALPPPPKNTVPIEPGEDVAIGDMLMALDVRNVSRPNPTPPARAHSRYTLPVSMT